MGKREMMKGLLSICSLGLVAGLWLAPAETQAQEPTAAEKIYAELAILPPEKRTARILEGAKKEGKLTAISSLRGQLTRDELKMFKEKYPFLNVEMSESGSAEAAERLVAEEVAGRHLTDVAMIAVSDLRDVIDRGFAARYATPAVSVIFPEYKDLIDKENRWTPFSVSEMGIVYNTNLIKPEDAPKSWDDLCSPKYKGTISLEPMELRFLYGVWVMLGESKFEKWLECIGKNQPIIQRGHTQRLNLMLAGDHAISPDQYFYQGVTLKRRDPKTPFGYVTSAPVLNYALANVINKNTTRPYAAALFTDWHLSREFQDFLANAPRGPIAHKNPYIPEGTQLIEYGFGSDVEYDRIIALWKKYMPLQ